MSDLQKGGRPRIAIDEKLMERLASIQCTNEEIAFALGTTVRTLARRGFVQIIDKARSSGRSSLRREQFRVALKGNPTMLIWLGKQYLEQRDAFEVAPAGNNDGRTLPMFVVQHVPAPHEKQEKAG